MVTSDGSEKGLGGVSLADLLLEMLEEHRGHSIYQDIEEHIHRRCSATIAHFWWKPPSLTQDIRVFGEYLVSQCQDQMHLHFGRCWGICCSGGSRGKVLAGGSHDPKVDQKGVSHA